MQASGVDCEGPKKQEDSEQFQGVQAQMNESTGLSSNVQQIDSDEESKVKIDEEEKVFLEEQLLQQEKDFKN